MTKLYLLVVLMIIYCLVGFLSSRSGPLMVGCMGYSVVYGLFRSTCLVCHIARPVLAILRIGVSGCVSGADFDLVRWSFLWTSLRVCCVLCLCMSLARDSANGGFVLSCLYMSWSLSSLLFSIVHMDVPSGLCNVVCVCLVWGVVLAHIVGLGVCLGPG